MNTQLEEVLARGLNEAIEMAKQTGQFVIDLAPDLIQQFLLWEMVSAGFWIVIGILFMSTFKIIIYAGSKVIYSGLSDDEKKKSTWKDVSISDMLDEFEEPLIAAFIGAVLFFIMGVVIVISHIHTLLFILTAPEIYLIKSILG